MSDPRLIDISTEARKAYLVQNARRRVSVLERRPFGGGGSGSVGPLTGEVIGPIGGNTINTAATPRVARLGVGVAADSAASLKLQPAALTNKGIDDTGHGEDQSFYYVSGTYPGLRWVLDHGDSSTPVTTTGASFKVSRYESFSSTTAGADTQRYCAVYGINVAAAASKAQPVGVVGHAMSYSEQVKVLGDDTSNPDAIGVQGIGVVRGNNDEGRGIGGDFEGFADSNGTRLTGIECRSRNNSGTDGTYTSTGGSDFMNLWMSQGGSNYAGVGIGFMGFSAANGFDVGIGFTTISRVRNATFRDDGTAATGIAIGGSHTTAGISIASTSGQLIVGATSTGQLTKALIRSSADGDMALAVQANSATQTNVVFSVNDSTAASVASIDHLGTVRASALLLGVASGASKITLAAATTAAGGILFGTDTNLYRAAADILVTDDEWQCLRQRINGTGGNGWLHFSSEQSSDPAAPAANGARIFTKDDGSGNTLISVRFSSGAVYSIAKQGGATQTYTATNVTTDRAFDADTVAVAELADVVGTLIADLRANGIVA